MSQIKVKFHANTVGIHHIGYRNPMDPVNVYTVIDYNVTVLGYQEQDIPIIGSLYCAYAGIPYTGYIIAACEDQTDSTSDGIPDLAIMWSVTADYQNPHADIVRITCDGGPLSVPGIVITGDGTRACTDGIYNAVITFAAGTEIVRAEVKIEVSGGVVISVDVVNGGWYTTAPTLTLTVPGCTTPITIVTTLVAKSSPFLLKDLANWGNMLPTTETSEHALFVGDVLDVIMDYDAYTTSGVPLPPEYSIAVLPGRCAFCEACHVYNIDMSVTSSGAGKLFYTTCWEGSPYILKLKVIDLPFDGGTIQINCSAKDSLVLQQDTLDVPPLITEVACP